jgi:hypothetical protein
MMDCVCARVAWELSSSGRRTGSVMRSSTVMFAEVQYVEATVDVVLYIS